MTAPHPRLFLVAPRDHADIAGCLAAACEIADVASLLAPDSIGKEIVRLAQAKNIAVLLDGDPSRARALGADGVQIAASPDDYAQMRSLLGRDAIIGALCGASRHAAMEMAEAGVDYLAYSQDAPSVGEPIIGWSADMLETPCVAFDPVDADGIAALLPQRPDFIRPADAMWASPDAARAVISAIMLAIGARP